MGRFVCDRCKTTWEGSEARCPNCLRKSSVRTLDRESSETARLASGDQSQTEGARRGTALLIAVALNLASGIAMSLVWARITVLPLRGPTVFACIVAGASWIGAALVGVPSWSVFLRRCALAIALGVWAFVSTTLAVASASDLSVPFTVGLAGVAFGAGVIGWLWWKRGPEEPEKPSSGKWR